MTWGQDVCPGPLRFNGQLAQWGECRWACGMRFWRSKVPGDIAGAGNRQAVAMHQPYLTIMLP
jgi:hypothetical protein